LHAHKMGGENFENWLNRMIEPSIHLELLDFEDGDQNFSAIVIEPTYDRPVRFGTDEYIRSGENVKKLKDFPEKERALWQATNRHKFESAVALPHQSLEGVLSLLDSDGYFKLAKESMPTPPEE